MDPPPKSWDELLPWVKRNKGKFAYCHPMKGGSGHVFLLALAYWINGYDTYKFLPFDEKLAEKLHEPLWNYLKELEPYLYPDNPHPPGNKATLDLLLEGEVGLVPAWMSHMMRGITVTGRIDPETFGVVSPSPPMPPNFDAVAIPFNAPHKHAALLFVNFLLSDEIQRRIPLELGLFPAIAEAYPGSIEIKGVKARGNWIPEILDKKEDYIAWRDPLKEPELQYRNGAYMFYIMKNWEGKVLG